MNAQQTVANILTPETPMVEYPAARFINPDGSAELFAFRNQHSRQSYIHKLVCESKPELKDKLTMEGLKSFLAEEKIELTFHVIKTTRNFGEKSWPTSYHCPICDSSHVSQYTRSAWDVNAQDWVITGLETHAHCMNCKEKIIAKEQFVCFPVTDKAQRIAKD